MGNFQNFFLAFELIFVGGGNLLYFASFFYRYVANRLSEMGETTTSDVDMGEEVIIAEEELSEKFSVQGIATGKNSGKTKIVSNSYSEGVLIIGARYLLKSNEI